MKILMVCLGNICRSPLAEGILKSKLSSQYTVDSCGTIDMHEGKNPDPRSVKTAQKYNVNISAQKSRHFKVSDFKEYDRIYCMDRSNLKDLQHLAQSDSELRKLRLILDHNQEVPDPYWGDLKDFDHVYHLLDAACDKIAAEMKAEGC